MTQKWPWSRLLSRRRGVAWRGQIAPVDSPESGAPFQIERAMALTLRFTAPLSTDYWDWLDYTIVEDGRRDVGRLYEDRHSRPELRWFWNVETKAPAHRRRGFVFPLSHAPFEKVSLTGGRRNCGGHRDSLRRLSYVPLRSQPTSTAEKAVPFPSVVRRSCFSCRTSNCSIGPARFRLILDGSACITL